MAFFLLEIGTEELPADFARLALPQLKDQLERDLHGARLGFGSIAVTSTPRRLAVLVDGLPLQQDDRQEEHKGPPAQQAFKDGVPTAAAEGFAKRCGLPVELLEVKETAKGPFVFATTRQQGRPTLEVLAECIPAWIWGLQGRRFMRWGQGESRFSRPVRWLVALLDEDVIPVDLPGCDPPIQSGRLSRGHRLRPEPVAIANAAAYGATLAAADVLVDRPARAAAIRTQLEASAAREEGRLDLPESLFAELVDLVEDPRVIEGVIEPAFLSLPPEVLSTVMRAHQRYVPLLKPDAPTDPLALSAERALLPRFLCVSNGLAEAEATVRRGNERVLRARLADAAFFLNADHAVASIDRREALSRVTFAEGLGSLRDRTERLEWCTDVLLESLHLSEAVAHASRRAAHLCKHDLVSQMVGEFPELQGVMGAKYLLAEGESRAVGLAVLEHYLPRGAGDALPESEPGAVVALAERFELLLSHFSRGERPSGSSDPYGLRRAGNGVMQILWHHEWGLNVSQLLQRSAEQWQGLFPGSHAQADGLCADLSEFLRQRFISLLEEDGWDQDIVQAIAAVRCGEQQRVLANVCEAKSRVVLLQSLRKEGQLSAIQTVVQRASRLAEKGELATGVLRVDQVVKPALFERASEAAMLEVLQRLAPIAESAERYEELASGLKESAAVLAAFFDGPDSVLVMCDDQNLRQNRLNLLGVLRNQAQILADFERLDG
ncbi:MAG: glycine--tRNA ligase subunit beta [Cyanobacteriota bacterium]|nr:glycine--tRNA ligase subunit beta [Cyanobacteriota bacterium]